MVKKQNTIDKYTNKSHFSVYNFDTDNTML